MSSFKEGQEDFYTLERMEILNKWMHEKWEAHNKKTCEVCGTNNWVIGESPIQIFPFSGGGITLGGSVYPCVIAVCDNCANTKFFNAAKIGLMKGGSNE